MNGWVFDRVTGAVLPESVVVAKRKSFGDARDPDCLMIYPEGSMDEANLRSVILSLDPKSEVAIVETGGGTGVYIKSGNRGAIIGNEGRIINAIRRAYSNTKKGKPVWIKVEKFG